MDKYNHTRTAYKPGWSIYWHLVPDGKNRAPLFGEGPRLSGRGAAYIPDEHINLLTNRDRIILLESIAGGCFDQTLRSMMYTLEKRSDENFKILTEYAREDGGN